jgi:hypothetical protein
MVDLLALSGVLDALGLTVSQGSTRPGAEIFNAPAQNFAQPAIILPTRKILEKA